MTNRNVTLSMPDDLVRRVRIHAATHDTSMSELIRDAVTTIVSSGDTRSDDDALLRPTWVPRATLVHLLHYQADATLSADLVALLPDSTDDVERVV